MAKPAPHTRFLTAPSQRRRGRRLCRLRQRPAQCARLFRGRFRGLHRAPAAPGHAPLLRKDDESPRTAVRRGTATAEDHSQRLRRKAGAQAHVRRAHPASASPNSSSVRSPPAEKNSTTNIRLQSRRWPGQPSPELPANPNLDLRETPRQKNLHAGPACCSAARRSGAEEMRTNSPKAERSISSSIVCCAATGSLFQRPRSPPSPR